MTSLPHAVCVTEKPCSQCKIVRPASEFSRDPRNKSGLSSTCHHCFREYQRLKKARLFVPLQRETLDTPEGRYCGRCKTRKPHDLFYANSKHPNGICYYCKECMKAIANPEVKRAYQRRYERLHRERLNAAERARYIPKPRKERLPKVKPPKPPKPVYPKGHKSCSRCKLIKPLDAFNNLHCGPFGKSHACKECLNSWDRQHYMKNRHAQMDKSRAWRKANPEKALDLQRKCKARNLDRYKQMRDAWVKANIETVRHYCKRRQARRKGAHGTHTLQEWMDLCALYGHKCVACGRVKRLTQDHVVPLIKGGSDLIENIQCLCQSCNSKKGTKSTDYRPTLNTSSD